MYKYINMKIRPNRNIMAIHVQFINTPDVVSMTLAYAIVKFAGKEI